MIPRRRLLQGSAAAAAFACTGFVSTPGGAATPRIEAPVVDSLSIQVVTDGNHDIFISGAQVPGVRIERVRGQAGAKERRVLRSEWGLSLWMVSSKGAETKRILLDFGWTGET